MAELRETAASLRIMGDSLDPDEISRLLCGDPTRQERTGDRLATTKSGHTRIARTSVWSRDAPRRMPGDIDAQVAEIFDGLTQDLEVWRGITSKYRTDLFCGLFLTNFNEGLAISAHTLAILGLRGVFIDLDIYGGNDNENDEDNTES